MDALQKSAGYADFEIGKAVSVLHSSLQEPLAKVLEEVVIAAGRAADRTFKPKRKARSLRTARFNDRSPYVRAWARRHSVKMVTDITRDTRIALRDIVSRAIANNTPPAQTARLIKSTIGLDSRRADAVDALRQRIIDNPGGKVWAGNRPIRVPEKVTTAYVRAQADKYAAHLLNDRAISIARTETIQAANEGQLQQWDQAVQDGLLDPNRDGKQWLPSPDACEECLALEGEVVALGESFEGGIASPPLHPNCRCSLGIADLPAETRAAEGWDEGDHPRDDKGQFSGGGGGGGGSSSDDGGGEGEGDIMPASPPAPEGFPANDTVRSGDMNEDGVVEDMIEEHKEHIEDDEDPIALRQAIGDYVQHNGSYLEMNRTLRGKAKTYARKFDEEHFTELSGMEADMNHIQNAIIGAPELDNVMVYRSTELSEKQLAKMTEPGATVRLSGFQSTSYRVGSATEFGAGGRKQLLEIRAVQGLYISAAEQEVLLPHGAKFEYLGRRMVDVEVHSRTGSRSRQRMEVIQLQQIAISQQPK